MTIDWTNFTPLTSITGGALLGVAAAIFIYLCGRILGISGIIGGLLKEEVFQQGNLAWRIRFILGLLLAPVIYYKLSNDSIPSIDSPAITVLIAGILVGIGTTLGSGCTSGHGICGLSRLSFRSLIATIIFMGFGVGTVYITKHLL
jgi:uncharacterized membrane protein YedE/YeeE